MIPAVCRYVFGMGVSPRHKGFAYICEVISALLDSGWPSLLAGSDIDAALKKVCGPNIVQRRAAERCMRYAVQYAWDTGGAAMHDLFNSRPIFGRGEACSGCSTAPPSLADFIYAAALELWESGVTFRAEAPMPKFESAERHSG